MLIYQKAVNNVRSAYFSDIISQNSHNPKILFRVVNAIICSPLVPCSESDVELSEKFVHRIENIRSKIEPDHRTFFIPMFTLPLLLFSHF